MSEERPRETSHARSIHPILVRIGRIYERPLMYGGDAQGVNLALWLYHELWAEFVDRGEELIAASDEAHAEEGCDAMNFPDHFRARKRGGRHAPESEAAEYVIRRWKAIDERMGLVIPDGARSTPSFFRRSGLE